MRWPRSGAARLRALAGAIAPLLATLLLMASVVAPAQCLAQLARPAAHGSALCAFDSSPAPDTGDHGGLHHAGGACVGCPLAPPLPAAAPALAVAQGWQPAPLPWPLTRAAAPSRTFIQAQPRAPPIV